MCWKSLPICSMGNKIQMEAFCKSKIKQEMYETN